MLDGPQALGWARWRAEGDEFGRMLIEASLPEAMHAGLVAEQPVRPLGFAVAGALESAALYAAHCPDPDAGLAEAGRALEALLDGLTG